MHDLTGIADLLQLATGVVLSPEDERPPCRRLVQRGCPRFELGADGRADEVRAVRIEALLDQKVDLTEIHKPKVDGDLLGPLRFVRCHSSCGSGVLPSIHHPYGW